LKNRVLSALVLIPVVLAALWLGGWPFTFLAAVLFGIAAWEFVRLFSLQGMALSPLVIFAHLLVWLAYGRWRHPGILALGLPGVLLLSVAEQIFTHRFTGASVARWALNVAGSLYLGVGGAYLLRVRWMADGRWWLLFTLATGWIADSAAYFVGRTWGRHKMAPLISPRKSWEGYAAGVGAAVLTGFLVGRLAPLKVGAFPVTSWRGVGLGALLALLTPLGDLFISLMKREVGVKDTSDLIPGHGGMLDRLDSLLWAGILTWLFVTLLVP